MTDFVEYESRMIVLEWKEPRKWVGRENITIAMASIFNEEFVKFY